MPPAGSSRAAGASTAPDRRQSARQGRTNVTRPTNYYARSFAGRMAALGGLEQTPPANTSPGFAPATTHFTQAVDAFPKELIKHFSLFKEVEAKTYDPERDMQRLLDNIAKLPIPTLGERRAAAQSQAEGEESAPPSAGGLMPDAHTLQQQLQEILHPPPETLDSLPPDERAELDKRQLFFNLRNVIHGMLPALEEKLVVLQSAKATKDKALARMQHSYAQLDGEISAEARYGSLTHWAYADKEEKKKGGTERSRREVASANNLAAAAQHVHDADSIAAKSDTRRDAVTTSKRNRHQHVDSDFDDRPVKKAQKRKGGAADAAATAAGTIGLGITGNGAAPQGKRKKTEKALAAAAAAPSMERSLSGALQATATGGRGVTSPRATPGAENTAKRKPRAAPAPAQRKRALPTNSPPVASSPLASTFAMSKATAGATEPPTSSRARKNSIANSVASAAQEPSIVPRPSTSHSVQQAPTSNAITELEQAAGIVRDTDSPKETSTPQEQVENAVPFEGSTLKHEEQETQEAESMDIDTPAQPSVSVARAGRTSKTATPVVGTFPESAPMARSRSTRNANNGNGNSQTSSENNSTTTGVVSKRGHKKNAQSTTSAVIPTPSVKPVKDTVPSGPPSTASSVAPDPEFSDGGDDGDDEPRYCYCNEVSYGNMIACDNETCPREWFHLACVNMEKAPNARTKWYCSDECREAYARANSKGKGGRPGNNRQ